MKQKIFNRNKLKLHRGRVCKKWHQNKFLKTLASQRLGERLFEIKRNFDLALDIGCHNGELGNILLRSNKIKQIIQSDLSFDLALIAKKNFQSTLVLDEEKLPFKKNVFNAIFSSFNLHWINKFPELLINIYNLLESDGLFLSNFLGGETLIELRKILVASEIEILGGSINRISPFIDIRSAGKLLQTSGFSMPVIDKEIITVTHSNIIDLFHDLRNMGENSCLYNSPITLRRDVINLAEKMFKNKFITKDNKISSTFELITMTAWSKHPDQPKPLRPGSGRQNLSDVLDLK